MSAGTTPIEGVLIPDDLQEINGQASKAYPTVRNIMYQTLKVSAECIGGVILYAPFQSRSAYNANDFVKGFDPPKS